MKTSVVVGAALVSLLIGAPRGRAGTLVNLNFTNFGTVQVDLFTEVSPLSVANFLQYIETNKYDGTIVHRSDVPLGVIQGGGYLQNGTPVTAFGTVNNESWLHNTRGTIAMARNNNINSATSQWFINTDDNTTDLGLPAGQGYTVFGWVVGGTMNVVDDIASVPTFAYNSPFSQIPLQDFTQQDKDNGVDPQPHSIVLASTELVLTHPTFQNPISRVDVNNDGLLSPLDALSLINSMLNSGIHTADPFESNPFAYRDVNGDGVISPNDLGIIFNAMLTSGVGTAPPDAVDPSVAPLVAVPEPHMTWLVASGLTSLAAFAVLRRRRGPLVARGR